MEIIESLHGVILPNRTVRFDSPRQSIRKSGLQRRIIPILRFNKSNPMKTIVTEFQFVDSFRLCGRESQFSVPARRALFEYLEEYENSIAEELTLDPIGLCCEWAEYPSALEAAKAYGFESEDNNQAEMWLGRKTTVVQFDGGIVIQQF
jgi:hypothetical protein